jgi:2,3-bisphosphoglycerate-dependent phosphoglycerate mutase
LPHCSIIFVRHGQSDWNLSGRFTGWTDINLTEVGREQAAEGGRELKRHGLVFNRAYTSELVRAQETMTIVLRHAQQEHVPVVTDWRINERHYGALQGLSKEDTVSEYGLEQVKLWRNSFSDPPPPAAADSDQNPANDPKYQHVPRHLLPNGECLQDTLRR